MRFNSAMAAVSVLALLLASTAMPAWAQTWIFQDDSQPDDVRIASILKEMTLDEKIDALSTNTGVPRLGIPNIGSSEGIHGLVQRGNPKWGFKAITTTQFPQPPGMGESWDPDIVRQAAGVEGYEARYISQSDQYGHKLLMLWGPQSDLARDPRWGRSEEVYGEDPFFNGTMAAAFSKGLIGDDPKYWQAAPLLKHFLANSNENNRSSSSSNFDNRLFWEYYSVPFRMAFQQGGARGLMASYNAWNGTPMTINPVLQKVVNGEWDADVISSDGGAVTNLVKWHKVFPNQEQAVAASLKAGINQYLDVYKDEMHAALKDGLVTEADINAALARKLRVTLKLGLLDDPARVRYSAIKAGSGPAPWNSDHDRAVSQKIALESVVLLKNDHATLPLDRSRLKTVAVVGPLADSVHWDWYGGYPPYAVTPLAGIKAALGDGVTVTYAAGGEEAVKAAKGADAVIVVVGNDPTCGPNMATDWNDNGTNPCADPGDGREGRDRETLSLAQEALVKQVHAVNPNTIMLLVSSFPYTINWSQQNVPAILHMTHSSQDEGTALAKVIFGDYNPGGHLVETWPASEAQLPPMMDYDIRHGRTYMYFDRGNWGKPLYPFGFGLSYTTFRYSNLRVSTPKLAKDGAMTIRVDVTNTGARTGDVVPQLYVQHLGSKVDRPERQLEGFQRVTVEPGQTRTVTIPLKAEQLAYWNDVSQAFSVETEPVRLMIGDSSADIRLSRTVRVQ